MRTRQTVPSVTSGASRAYSIKMQMEAQLGAFMGATEAALVPLSPDDEAMRRVAGGDTDALAGLFDRHKTGLLGFLYRMVGDRSLAEDLVGETFLRLYGARRRYRPGSGFTSWLYAIARNLAVAELRRREVRARLRFRLRQEPEPSRETWEAGRDALRERVQAALLKLPEDQRAAVVLKEYQGLGYREIASVLGCSEEAARARAYRARAALREELKEWMTDD